MAFICEILEETRLQTVFICRYCRREQPLNQRCAQVRERCVNCCPTCV